MSSHYHPQHSLCNHLSIEEFLFPSRGNAEVFYLSWSCPVCWGCRIHQLHLCRGVRPPTKKKNECSGYDTKQSDGEVPVMLELLGMWSTPPLPSPEW